MCHPPNPPSFSFISGRKADLWGFPSGLGVIFVGPSSDSCGGTPTSCALASAENLKPLRCAAAIWHAPPRRRQARHRPPAQTPLCVGACDHRGSCSQTAPISARISCQPHGRCAHIICQHARHHRRVLANRRSCLHCLPMLAFQAGSSSRPDSGHPQRQWRVGSCLRGQQVNVVRTARLGPAEPRAPAESGPCKCEMMPVRYAPAGLSRAKGGSPNQHTWKTNPNKTCSVFNIRRVFPSAMEITDPLQNRGGSG